MDVEINRKAEQMVFDTGADFSLLSGRIISDLGMSIPNRPPDGYSGGVGNRKRAAMWLVPVDIKVGSIERRNFRVGMSEAPQQVALLGRDFLKGLQYTINDAYKTVTFKRADTADSTKIAKTTAAPVGPDGSVTVTGNGTYVYNVPFTTAGNGQIIIEAKINGQLCKMIFDTGASVCFFTPEQAARSGINVPADAQVIPIYGVSGNTAARVCPIPDIKVGPLDEKDVACAIGKSAAPMPLLGQSFFKAYKYTIDSTNKVIVFTKQN
jgi:aspartyl protease family protein